MSEQNIGTVVQITGPVLDIKFAADALPKLLNAITIDNHGQIITVEVAQHIGQDTVRCIAMEIHRRPWCAASKAVDTGSPITVPVGDKNLGRIFNLLGQPVDNQAGGRGRRSAGRSTVRRRPTRSRSPRPRSSRPASRSST